MIMEQRIRSFIGLFLVLFSAECNSIVLFDAAPQTSSAFIDYSSYEPKVISSTRKDPQDSNPIFSQGGALNGGEEQGEEEENSSEGFPLHKIMRIINPHQLTKPNVVRRNYLRFGKKRSSPKTPSGLERRDYREFVRFGKRSGEYGNGNAKSFLRFGRKSDHGVTTEDPLDEIWSGLSQDKLKALAKRVNDYLRFG